jgi:hypothetical protein
MSQIDTVFSALPGPLLQQWGQDLTYIKSSTPRFYNPTTGSVNGADVSVAIKGVITRLTPRESEGLYQTTDLKVIIGTAELGTYYPTEADRIQYTQDGVIREAKIVAITSYRGDNPVLHTLIARPQ